MSLQKKKEKKVKNYQKLIDTYPQLVNNTYNDCVKETTMMLMKIEQPRMWAKVNYGMMGYTDLGHIKQCEDENEGAGSYIQFLGGVTSLPLKLPLSFCLPKACGDKVYFQKIAEILKNKGNDLLTELKKDIDFDNLVKFVDFTPGEGAASVVQQLTGILSNNTQLKLSVLVPTQDHAEQENKTSAIWIVCLVLFGTMVVALVFIPNILLTIIHFMEKHSNLPLTLQELIEQQESDEQLKPEIKIKRISGERYISNLGSGGGISPTGRESAEGSVASSQYEGGSKDGRILKAEPSHRDSSVRSSKNSAYGGKINNTLLSYGASSYSGAPSFGAAKLHDENKYIKSGSFIELVYSFSFGQMYAFSAGTRCKPWDNRELDVLDGFKFWSFVFYTISQTAFTLFYTQLVDLLQIFALLDRIEVNTFICSNLALENFVFVSAFIGFYRCFQIMEASHGMLTALDILKLYGRKFIRLAPAYYSMWIIIWGLSARIGTGPIWHTTNMNMLTCNTTWLPTLFFVGNIYPFDIAPYEGCYQQAWPLQVDMQIAIFIPFLAMIYYKFPVAGVAISFVFIGANIAINMYYTYAYGLTIGLLDHGQYYLMQTIISKPWTKLQNVGHAGLLAMIYWRILKYRELKTDQQKVQYHPTIHWMTTSKLFGKSLILLGLICVIGNLTATTQFNQAPQSSSELQNALYYGFSRPTFVLGAFCILLSILLGHFGFARAFLAGNNVRLIAKSLAIGCVLEILLIELLFCSDAAPDGIYLTFPVCLLFGLGFQLVTALGAIFLLIFIEFPITRVFQLTILKFISHDDLLRSHMLEKDQIENHSQRLVSVSDKSNTRGKTFEGLID